MEFESEKYAMGIRKSGKRETMEGIELPNQDAWREGKLQVLGNIGSRHKQTSGDER